MKVKSIYLILGIVAVGILALAILLPGKAQEPPPNSYKDPDEAARVWLDLFLQTVNQENYAGLGFESLDESKQASLGAPLVVHMVGLDQLKKYQVGTEFERYFIPAGKMFYPVLASDQVRVQLEIGQSGDLWSGERFGSGDLAGLLNKYRQLDNDSVMAIPALNQYFIATQPDRELLLIPILDDPDLGFHAGEALPAKEVFSRLSKLAVSLEEDVPR